MLNDYEHLSEHIKDKPHEINAQNTKSENSPLHLAVLYNQMNSVKLLLSNGANANLKNNVRLL